MIKDDFFTKKNCDRCGAELGTRIMSWFNKETICLNCADKERTIRVELHKQGKTDHEGCGYIPNV